MLYLYPLALLWLLLLALLLRLRRGAFFRPGEFDVGKILDDRRLNHLPVRIYHFAGSTIFNGIGIRFIKLNVPFEEQLQPGDKGMRPGFQS